MNEEKGEAYATYSTPTITVTGNSDSKRVVRGKMAQVLASLFLLLNDNAVLTAYTIQQGHQDSATDTYLEQSRKC
jgi:hypothetical protein